MRKRIKLTIRIVMWVAISPAILSILLGGMFAWAFSEDDISYWEYIKRTGIFR